MKRILAFAFAATACTSANASLWHQFTPESYFLIPSNSKDILAGENFEAARKAMFEAQSAL